MAVDASPLVLKLSRDETEETEFGAPLTDDEGCSEAGDSDFGLSDRQLEDLWQAFSPGEVPEIALGDGEVPEIALGDGEDPECDLGDADFGLSDQQFRRLGKRCSEAEDPLRQGRPSLKSESAVSSSAGYATAPLVSPTATPLDPLQHFMRERRSQAALESGKATGAKAKGVEKFIEQQLPSQPSIRPARAQTEKAPRGPLAPSRRASVDMVSSREMDGTTWYLFRVRDQGAERFYMKRYSDFKRLDALLRAAPTKRQSLPALPEGGLLGLRHIMDVGDFNTKRRDKLARYIREIVAGVYALRDDPVLEAFFGEHAPGRIFRDGALKG